MLVENDRGTLCNMFLFSTACNEDYGWMCDNRQCIYDVYKMCDGLYYDCSDGSDEKKEICDTWTGKICVV